MRPRLSVGKNRADASKFLALTGRMRDFVWGNSRFKNYAASQGLLGRIEILEASALTITLDDITVCRYYVLMIRSFRCSETEKIFRRTYSQRLPQSIQRIAMRKLWMLDAVTQLSELRVPPSNHLEALHGKRKGPHSIRINRQWRICFHWQSGDAHDVEIVDYH